MTRIRDCKAGYKWAWCRLAIGVLRTGMYSRTSSWSLTPWSTTAAKSCWNACIAPQPSAECCAWGVWAWPLGSLSKIPVLKIDRHTVLQGAGWTSREGLQTWLFLVFQVYPIFLVYPECLQPDLGLPSTFLTCGQHSSCRKKLQVLNLGACGLKDKSKAFIPCSPHPAASAQMQCLSCSYCRDSEMQVAVRQEHFELDNINCCV